MRKPGLIFLIVALALAAFWLGTRYRPAPPVAAAPDPTAAAASAAAREADASSRPESQPTRTFRGPDGRPHLINYEVGKTLDDTDAALVRAAVLEDMRNHPRNIVSSYDIPLADVEAIVAGKKPYPPELLPAPPPAPAR
jgi:hypothetical protein